MVYKISKPSGETLFHGWGPRSGPLKPLLAVPAGVRLARAVATGELVLTSLLGDNISGFLQCGQDRQLTHTKSQRRTTHPGRCRQSRRPGRVFLLNAEGGVRECMSWQNLHWLAHRLHGDRRLRFYNVKPRPSRGRPRPKKPVGPIAQVEPVAAVGPVVAAGPDLPRETAVSKNQTANKSLTM